MAKLSVEQALLKAKSLAKKGELAEASKLYTAILAAFPNNKKAFITTQLMAQLFDMMIESGCELDKEHKINCNRLVSLIHGCETLEQVNALKQLKLFKGDGIPEVEEDCLGKEE